MNKICAKVICAGLMFSGVCLCSCESLEDTWSEYLAGGEIIYAPKADTLYCHSGKERVALNYVITKSPNLKEMRVVWNDGEGEQTFPLELVDGESEGVFYIEGLTEKSYTFEVTMIDSYGHASLVSELFSRAYGDLYGNALKVRGASVLRATEGGGLVEWMPAAEGFLYNEVKYLNNNDEEVTVVSETDDVVTSLPGIRSGTGVTYRSAYKPDENCVDVFYTEWTCSEDAGLTLPHLYESEQAGVKRSQWKVVSCESNQPGDGDGPAAMLDGNPNSYWHSGYNENRVACPFAIVFDMQESLWISSVGLMQRNGGYNFRMTGVDVYVSDDGSDGNNWTLIARTSPVATDDMQWFEVSGSIVERQVKGRFLKLVVTHTYDNDDGITGLAEVDVQYVKAVDGVPLYNK